MVEGRGEKNKDEELWGGSWKSCQECLQLRPTLAMARLQFQTFPSQSSLEECKLFALRRDAKEEYIQYVMCIYLSVPIMQCF